MVTVSLHRNGILTKTSTIVKEQGSHFLSVLGDEEVSGNNSWNNCCSVDPDCFPKALRLDVFVFILFSIARRWNPEEAGTNEKSVGHWGHVRKETVGPCSPPLCSRLMLKAFLLYCMIPI